MPDDSGGEKDMEALTRAIVDAITRSREVREAVKRLSDNDDVCSKSFMVLMLKVRNLAETMGVELHTCSHEGSSAQERFEELKRVYKPKTKNGEPSPPPQPPRDMVDGAVLSPEEAAFREYLAEKFDEQAWLRKLGLIM